MGKLVVMVDWPYGMVPWDFWKGIWRSDIRHEKDVTIIRAAGPEPTISANKMVRWALDHGADEIFGCPVDQDIPENVLEKFRAHNKDIVCALTPTRQPGHHWITFNFDAENKMGIQKDPEKPLERYDVLGSCALYKADVFRRIEPPWFKSSTTPDGCELTETSDFYFARKCKEAGVEMYLDATVESAHKHELWLNAQSLGRALPFLEVVNV